MFWLFYRIKDYFSKYERHMRKADKFYANPFKEETYALDSNIIKFLLPRLKLFIEDSSRIVDWDSDDDHRKVKDNIPKIIADFQFYLDNYDTNDFDTWLSAQERVEEGLRLLIEIYRMLGW